MANTNPHLDATGLSQVWAAIVTNFAQKKDLNKDAQVNVIESVKVNGVALEITDKSVNVLVPTGALASLDKVSADQLDSSLAGIINSVAGKADKATTLSGYGITDAYTKTETDTAVGKKADKATTLSGYGIADAYTKTEVDTAVGKKADASTTLAGYGITDAYAKSEVYTKTEADSAIDAKIKTAVAGVYKVKGSIAFTGLPTSGMADGDVYNITDAFVTTDDFREGSGKSYPAGTNVAYVEADKKWDCLAGTYDFSSYLTADDIRSLTSEEIAAICVIS